MFFIFPDDLIYYDCIECGGKCCKGFGFSGKDELIKISADYPTLPFFMKQPIDGGEIFLKNFQPRCWFLGDNNLCKIQSKYGLEHKPNVCKTFPVNKIYHFKDNIIISINLLCPIEFKPSYFAKKGSIFLKNTIKHDFIRTQIAMSEPIKINNIIFKNDNDFSIFCSIEGEIIKKITDATKNEQSFFDFTRECSIISGFSSDDFSESISLIDEKINSITQIDFSKKQLSKNLEKKLIGLYSILRFSIIIRANKNYMESKSVASLFIWCLHRMLILSQELDERRIDSSTINDILSNFFEFMKFIILSNKKPKMVLGYLKAVKSIKDEHLKPILKQCLYSTIYKKNISIWDIVLNEIKDKPVARKMSILHKAYQILDFA